MSSFEFLSHLEDRTKRAKHECESAEIEFQSYYDHCYSSHEGTHYASGGDRVELDCLDLNRRYARGVYESFQETLRVYRAATASVGADPTAMHRLASLFRTGCWSLNRDEEKAKFWHYKAAELGNLEAMFDLGLRYEKHEEEEEDKRHNQDQETGVLLPRSPEQRAMEWYERAASKGHALSALKIAQSYDTGIGVTQEFNPDKAMEWYLKAAEQWHTEAILKVAQNHEFGRGVDAPDIETAIKWYERAANRGCIEAILKVTRFYEDANAYDQAIEWCKQAASTGDINSKVRLALLLLKKDTPESRKDAQGLLLTAAEGGHLVAMVSLAELYTRTQPNLHRGALWYMKAAEALNTKNMTLPTRAQARHFYLMAADGYMRAGKGPLEDLKELAHMFEQGTHVVEADWKKAIKLLFLTVDRINSRVCCLQDNVKSFRSLTNKKIQEEMEIVRCQTDATECYLRAIRLKKAIWQKDTIDPV